MNYKKKLSLEPYVSVSFNKNNFAFYNKPDIPLVAYPLTFQLIDSNNTILFSGFKASDQVIDKLKLPII